MSYRVWNVAQLKADAIGFNFSILDDHSKWAVNAPSSQKPWICVGDINRAVSLCCHIIDSYYILLFVQSFQKLRGGGTVCLNSPLVAKAFYSLIKTVESC